MNLFAAFALCISAFLPWYKETDLYADNLIFLGITGPTYLFGIMSFFAGLTSISLSYMKIKGIGPKSIRINFVLLQTLLAISVFMLGILAYSVLFHKNFGINITQKSIGFGLYGIIIFSVIMLLTVLINKNRSEVVSTNIKSSELEAFIDINDRIQNTEIRNRSVEELTKLHERLYNR